MALYGGFAGVESERNARDPHAHITVLSGDLEGNDVTNPNGVVTNTANLTGTNAYHVVTGNGATETALLDGFTITAGKADSNPHYYGGGMYNDSGSPTARNVTFSGNTATWGGGGMYNKNGSSPALTNATFSSNSTDVSGGGMYNSDNSNPRLANVVFSGNSARHGGGMYNSDSNPTLTNIIFSSNSAIEHGGGMSNLHYSRPQLVNVTLSGNYANIYGGGMYNYWYSEPTLINCILWSNTADFGPQIYNGSSTSTISYSLVQGSGGSGAGWDASLGTDGGGNIDADPLFVDAAYDNLRLHHDSPAVDAGDSGAVPPGVTTDLDGNPRFLDIAAAPDTGVGSPPIVDMGAYEQAATDLHIVKLVSHPFPLYPGNPITYTLSFVNGGSTIAAGVVITDTIPSYVVDTSVTSAGVAITNIHTGQPYVWAVSPLAPGAGGVIIITGQISPTLTGRHTFTNTVVIATTSVDPNTANNMSSIQSHVHLVGVIYVDRDAAGPADGLTWATAFTDVQDALTSAWPGDEIWVAEGVYTPGIARTDTFQLKEGVALYGGFAGVESERNARDPHTHITVLSGDLDGNDVTDANGVVTNTANITGTNAYHVVTNNDIGVTAVLDGFTITAGKADTTLHSDGGGMYNNGSSPTLTNLTFSGNYAIVDGGGMHNERYSSPTLVNATFSGNRARYGNGGGMYNLLNSSPQLTNVSFTDNSAGWRGGGMSNDDHCSPELTNVTFSGNSAGDGGGMFNLYNSNPTLVNVTFSGNTANNGGGMDNRYNSPTMVNITFSGNSATYGGGMYNHDDSTPILTNVTFSGNAAVNGGGIYNRSDSNSTLSNCILWGNTASDSGHQIYNDSGTSTISYSLVQGGCPAGASCSGIIDADPQFVRDPSPGLDGIWGTVDDGYGDLRPVPPSPAIDAGNNGAVPSGVTTDLDGNPRFLDVFAIPDTGSGTPPIVDMGAYEATEAYWQLPLRVFVPLALKKK